MTKNASLASKIRELHAEGLGCRAIAREMGISPTHVSRIAKAEGLIFDRASTKAAIAARLADLAELRSRVALDALRAAQRSVERMSEPTTLVIRRKDGTETIELPEPTSTDVRNYAVAVGVALDKTNVILREFPETERESIEQGADLLRALQRDLDAKFGGDDNYGSAQTEGDTDVA